MVRELAALLERAGIDDQLVLVGHSSGGFNVRVFATQYPARIAGLVFADTSHEDQRPRFAAAKAPTGEMPALLPYVIPAAASVGITRLVGFGAGLSIDAIHPRLRQFVNAVRFQTSVIASSAEEYRALNASAADVRETRRTLSVPLIVLTRTHERHPAADLVWRELQADLEKISTRACRTPVENSGHLIPSERPVAVIAAIEEVVAASTAARVPSCTSLGTQVERDGARRDSALAL
jgi:pimeloyl-ACP methyl ester carboxylesterase